jgi:hypothetical protein
LEAQKQPDTTDAPVNSDSSDSQMSHYFKEKVEVETKPKIPAGFGSLFDQITSKRKDFEVEQEVPTIEISNQTEVMAEEAVAPTVRPTMAGDLMSQIHSKRLEYGTPNVATVGLPRPELSPINLNPDPIISNNFLPNENESIEGIDNGSDSNSDDLNKETSPIADIIDFKSVNFEIHRGPIKDRFIDIDFGQNFKDVQTILIINNDGKNQYFEPHKISNSPKQTIK